MGTRRQSDNGWALTALLVATAVVSTALVLFAAAAARQGRAQGGIPARTVPPELQARYQLFDELRPVRLANCQLERFGEQFDGGYLMCGNLLDGARAAYSYGISGYDGWGCDVAARLSATTHQYDCFNLQQPVCTKGTTVFHPLCIAGEAAVDTEGRVFQSLEQQLADNKDDSNRIVVKMDVEGAEWESLKHTPDAVLGRIDQLVIELHGIDEPLYLDVVRKLKQTFHVVHVHANNYTCSETAAPFPATVYEVLFVNKRIGRVAARAPTPKLPHPLDSPNVPNRPNCVPRWR
jgi:hypothetical protein